MQIEHVTVSVWDVRATSAWLREVAGFAGEGNTVVCGYSRIELVEDRTLPDAYIHLAFTISENHLDQAVTWARTHATLLDERGDIIHGSGAWDSDSVYFEAPGGLNLEFIARRRLQLIGDGAFAPATTVGISEVGFASVDPMASNSLARETFGLDAFGEPSSGFAPVGDDHGLLIFADAQGIWAPTSTHRRRSVSAVQIVAPNAGEAMIDGALVTARTA